MGSFFYELIKNERYDELNFYIDNNIIDIQMAINYVLKMQDSYYIYKFALFIHKSPIQELAYSLIALKNVEFMYYFARDVNGAPIDLLAKEVIDSKNAKYIYEFARDVTNCSITDLALGMVATNNALYIYIFASFINNAPLDILTNGIIATKNEEYIFKFALNIKNACFQTLALALIELDISYFQELLNIYLKKEETYNEKYQEILNKQQILLSLAKTFNIAKKNDIIESISQLRQLYNRGSFEEIKQRKNEFATIFNGKNLKKNLVK